MINLLALFLALGTPNAPAERPEAALYDPARTASADVDAALARARTSNKRVMLAMGANWCHDSKALAGWFETPRFKAMLAAQYELVYVDVGMKNRNIDIAQRFGIKAIKGTPTLLNKKDAPGWRNAASRSEDEVFAYFQTFGVPKIDAKH
jgi:thiol-disulfide isomerase/thioredoxin